MGAQVHFCGLEIASTEVRATVLRRDGTLVAWHRQELVPQAEEEDSYAFAPLRWARLAGDTVREAIEASGVPTVKIWGYAPVAPPGWICLDAQWSPMTNLTVAKESLRGRIAGAVGAYLRENRRRASRIGLVAAPKDYLRFHWSQVFATDVTDVAAFGLLSEDKEDWDRSALADLELRAEWFSPTFPSAFACGRITPEGAEATGLQPSAWTAVGSTPIPARMAGSGVLDTPAVYLFAHEPDSAFWRGTGEAGSGGEPAVTGGGKIFRSPRDNLPPEAAGRDTPFILDWLEGEDPEPILRWAAATGRPLFRAPFSGRISPGAAVIAALASGSYAGVDAFYRRYPAPQPIERPFDPDALI